MQYMTRMTFETGVADVHQTRFALAAYFFTLSNSSCQYSCCASEAAGGISASFDSKGSQ
jgi:hypothetical protein